MQRWTGYEEGECPVNDVDRWALSRQRSDQLEQSPAFQHIATHSGEGQPGVTLDSRGLFSLIEYIGKLESRIVELEKSEAP